MVHFVCCLVFFSFVFLIVPSAGCFLFCFFVLSFSGLNPTGRHTIKVKAKRKSMGPDPDHHTTVCLCFIKLPFDSCRRLWGAGYNQPAQSLFLSVLFDCCVFKTETSNVSLSLVCVPSVWGYYRHWPDRSYGKYHWQIILVKRSKSGRFFEVEQSEWFIFFPFFCKGGIRQAVWKSFFSNLKAVCCSWEMFVGRGEMKITGEKKTKSRERVMSSLSALVKSTSLLKGAKSLFSLIKF